MLKNGSFNSTGTDPYFWHIFISSWNDDKMHISIIENWQLQRWLTDKPIIVNNKNLFDKKKFKELRFLNTCYFHLDT